MLKRRPNSTDLAMSTPAPVAASSSISSVEISSSFRALGTILGSAVNTPSTSVQISQTSAPKAAANATAEASDPPRPSVVTSLVRGDTPWKPATITTFPSSSDSWTRKPRISSIFASPCASLVRIPACDPVKLTASRPSAWIAMASRAIEIRSPAVSNMSISRAGGDALTWSASAIRSSVVEPIAETTTITWLSSRRVSAMRPATRLSRSASATDVPPYF